MLISWFRQAGVSVGTNYTEIAKLPSTFLLSPSFPKTYANDIRAEYATFGKFSQAATNEAVKDLVEGTSPPSNPSSLPNTSFPRKPRSRTLPQPPRPTQPVK